MKSKPILRSTILRKKLKASSRISFKDLKLLADWYQEYHRPLPWRVKTPSPYAVWISEVMSQQSTMPTVIRYFDKWMKVFPRLQNLSSATEDQVLHLWQGLGYYSRARNVLKTAKVLQQRHDDGQSWPTTVKEWKALPGIGDYTAKAIVSICFGGHELPVDGNVIRVISRVFAVDDPLNCSSDQIKLREHVREIEKLIFKKLKTGILAQAFMELGSEICRPRALAQCGRCPLQCSCKLAHSKRLVNVPIKKQRRGNVELDVLSLIYRNQDSVLLRQIPKGERLAGQWELPQWVLKKEFPEINPIISRFYEIHGPIKHQITHHKMRVWGVEAGKWSPQNTLPKQHRWIKWSDLELFEGAITTVSRKLLFVVEKTGR